MPLDPQAAAMIASAKAAKSPSIATLPIAESRAAYRERYLARGPKPAAVERVEELNIPGPAGAVRSRLYVPQGGSAAGSLVVYFHGGGFVVGDVEAYDAQSRLFAQRTGCTLLVPDYRLAPEHPHPAAVDDALAVVRWASRHARRLGVEPARIAVAGDSAGGNLAAVVSQCLRDLESPLVCQLLLYPVTDYRPFSTVDHLYESTKAFASGYFLDRSTMEWFRSHHLPNREDALQPRASPLLAPDAAFRDLPPAYVVTAGYDPLRDMGKAYADRLTAAGVPVTYRCFETLIHNFLGYMTLVDAAGAAFDEIAGELARRMSVQTG